MSARIVWTGCILLGLACPVFSQEAFSGPRPPVEIILTPGEASAVPVKKGVAYVNGGVIDVAQPNPTTVVVTMTGMTAANADLLSRSWAQYQFDLTQGFQVAFNSKRVKSVKLTLESRVEGLLRTEWTHTAGLLQAHKKVGSAETLPAAASVSCGTEPLASVTLPGRSAPGCDDLSIYNHEGPVSVSVGPGQYTLSETWGFGVTHPAFNCRGASAEFAPQPSYLPESYWFSDFRPFNGLASRDFGFQMTLKIVPEFKEPEEEPTPTKKP
jgi:hypothetical protein